MAKFAFYVEIVGGTNGFAEEVIEIPDEDIGEAGGVGFDRTIDAYLTPWAANYVSMSYNRVDEDTPLGPVRSTRRG